MKKFLAILLAVMMMFVCCVALADDADKDQQGDDVVTDLPEEGGEEGGEEQPANPDAQGVQDEHGAIETVEYIKNGKIYTTRPSCALNPYIARYFYEDGFYKDQIEETDHNWEFEGDCYNGQYKCTVCGATKPADALGHIWSSDVDAPDSWGKIVDNAWCNHEGLAIDYCKRCGLEGTKTRVIEKPDHMWEIHVDEWPYCDKELPKDEDGRVSIHDGTFHLECAKCGEWYVNEQDYEDDLVDEETGRIIRFAGLKGEVAVFALDLETFWEVTGEYWYDGHDWDGWVNEIEPTCHNPGRDVRWCKRCGQEDSKLVMRKLHGNEAPYDALELVEEHLVDCYHRFNVYRCPMCADSDCKICDEYSPYGDGIVYGWFEEEPHREQITETLRGATETFYYETNFHEISKEDVQNNNLDAFQPTEAHEYAIPDLSIFYDEENPDSWKTEMQKIKVIVDGEEHTADEFVDEESLVRPWLDDEPDCTKDGSVSFKCIHNDEHPAKTVKLDAPGHNWTEWVLEHAAGEGENEWNHWVHTCRRCLKTEDFNGTFDPIACEDKGEEHEFQTLDGEPATCTEGGYEHIICVKCGHEEWNDLEATGHDLKEEIINAATCTENGRKLISCTKCDFMTTETIEATGHTPKTTKEAKDATCAEAGWTKEITCETCKTVLTPSTDIEATGKHDWKIVPMKEATTEEEGNYPYMKCSVCGKEEGKVVIPKVELPKTEEKTEETAKTEEKTEETAKTEEKTEETVKTEEKTEETVKTEEKTEETTKTEEKTEETTKTEEKTEEPKNGIVKDEDGKYRAYKDDEVDTTVSGIVDYDGGKFIFANGVLQDVDGLWQDPATKEWGFYADGQFQDKTGFAEYDGYWFMLKDGKLDTTANGIHDYDGGKFVFAAGQLQKNLNGLWLDPATNEWVFVAGGQVQTQYSGVAEYNGEFFVLKDGKLDKKDGTVTYDGVEFLVSNGQLYPLPTEETAA